ncbi:hypothetical protein HLH17_02220 [Acinetobacter sp. ANC 5380]|uniref:Uncharacterized protein n=1 Tax=Acinetobacter terrae TaxID=2731247 RepID=A0A7Y2RCZ0_9GAMM|nr:hypothetical protein [Acinetobacter terrae]NNH76517.1 hypothetical protein [Acinetobacter terrae]
MERKRRDFGDDYIGPVETDYKSKAVLDRQKIQYESINNWLYIGADSLDPSFAKIGITSGDLKSRSYSSARPSYFIFCAFKFKVLVSLEQMKEVEKRVLRDLDEVFVGDRLWHYESGKISECYMGINFKDLLCQVHFTLYDSFYDNFVAAGYEDYGIYLDCEFNSKVEDRKKYIEMILQAD